VAQNNNGKTVFEKDMPDCPKCGKKLRRMPVSVDIICF
jgi:rRNA maturation endonuclease Nob1